MRFLSHILLAVTLTASACGDDERHCPGECPAPGQFPTLTLRTADGTPSIASVKMLAGACTYLLCDSGGQDGATASFAAVRIAYSRSSATPPSCLVELTSVAGDRVKVTAQAIAKDTVRACCAYGTCCARIDTLQLHSEWEFDPPVTTVSFPPAPDAGQAPDSGEILDATPYDFAAVSSLDGEVSLDASEPIDADEAVDANPVADVPVGL